MESWGEVSKINLHIFAKQNAWKTFNLKKKKAETTFLTKDCFDILVFLMVEVNIPLKVNIPKFINFSVWLFSVPCTILLECILKTLIL